MRRDISSGPLPTLRGLPIGAVLGYGGASAPAKWLLCDGAAVSRATYSRLFGLMGTSFGTGDGSTTFNLPDFRGRFALGKDNLGGSSADRVTAAEADTIGQASGSESHTLTTAQMPSHTHNLRNSAIIFTTGQNVVGPDAGGNSSESIGGGGAHNNMPPYQTVNYIVKVQ